MPRLVLVKHSLPKITPELPRREWHLSEEGLHQCMALASHLRRYDPARIAASPEPKAQETALAIAGGLGRLDVETLDGLREHNDGDTAFQSNASFRAAVAGFFAHPAEAVFGSETADAAHTRFSAAVAGLVQSAAGQSVVAVAHGRVISLLVARRNDLEPYAFWARLGHPAVVVLGLPEFEIEEVIENA